MQLTTRLQPLNAIVRLDDRYGTIRCGRELDCEVRVSVVRVKRRWRRNRLGDQGNGSWKKIITAEQHKVRVTSRMLTLNDRNYVSSWITSVLNFDAKWQMQSKYVYCIINFTLSSTCVKSGCRFTLRNRKSVTSCINSLQVFQG